MVRRFFEKIAAPVRGLHQAAYVLAGLTLASQLLALLRDRTFTNTFGAGRDLDLYYAAFRIPDLVFALVASLISAYVLIPRLSSAGSEATKQLLSQAASFLLIGGGVICAALAIFTPQLLALLYPDFAASNDCGAFIMLTRVLLLQPIILGLSGIVTSVSQVHRRFALFALSPVLYNAGIIFGTLVLYPRYGLPGIGFGVVIGAFLHVAIHIPVLLEARVFPRPVWPQIDVLTSLFRDSIPRSLALGIGSFTALALTVIAARLEEGSISVFTLAANLEAVPLALVGASYAVAAFPALSEVSKSDRAEFTRILSASARHIILWSIVATGLIIVMRAHLVRAILGTGAFDWGATRLTAALLAIFVVGLLAQGLVLLFSRALYAAGQSWRPFLYQTVGGVLTVVFAIVFLTHGDGGTGLFDTVSHLLKVSDVPGTSILWVALASTLGQLCLVLLSLLALRTVTPGLAKTLLAPLIDGVCASAVGGAAAYGVLHLLGGIAPLTTLAAVFTQGAIAGMVGLTGAALTLYVLSNEEFADMWASAARFAKARFALAPSAEEPAQP